MSAGWLLVLGAVYGLGIFFTGSCTDSRSISGALAHTALTGQVRGVSEVGNPTETGAVARDGRTAVAQVSFTINEDADAPAGTLHAVKAVGSEARQSGLRTVSGGEPYDSSSLTGPGELIGLGLALAVLVITFGSLLGAGLPPITAASSSRRSLDRPPHRAGHHRRSRTARCAPPNGDIEPGMK